MPPRRGKQNSFRVNQGNWGLFQPAPNVEYEDRRKIDRDLLKVTHWRGATKYVEINDILHKLRFTTPPTNAAQTFSSGDATPSVQGGGMFITAGTTAITDFDDGEVGDVLYIYANSSITITHGTPIQLNGDANYAMVAGDTLILAMWNDQVWHEMGRGGQASGGSGDAWNTTKKTANYTATDNDEVLCDTATTGAFTVTLPASPTGGERVRIIDSAANFGSANLTVGRNSNTIRGVASDLVINTSNQNYEFVFNGTDSDWEYCIFEPDASDRRYIQIEIYEPLASVATGDGQKYLHIPADFNGLDLVEVHAEVITAGTTGTTDIQIHNATDSVDMLSTKLTIDSGETGSDTAATVAVINTSNDDVATNDLLRVDIDAVSTTVPKGLIVTLGFE